MYRTVVVDGHTVELLYGERLDKIIPAPVPHFRALPDAREQLRRLTGSRPGEPIGLRYPAIAAIPPDADAARVQKLFDVIFGRDSLTMARTAASVAPALMPTTLRYLARHQGVAREVAPEPQLYDRRREENGRIVHEVRNPLTDEWARELSERWGWAWPFYNTDDASLLYARELAEHALQHPGFLRETVPQRDGVNRSMAESLLRTLEWIETRCRNPEGLFESSRGQRLSGTDPELPSYPVWQDSPDAAHRPDGSLCTGPVAWIELQAQYHDALLSSARLAERGLLPGVDAAALRDRAHRLQGSVLRHFRSVDAAGRPLVVYATERVNGAVRPLRVLKSNPAAALDSTLFDGPAMRGMVATILEQTFDPARGLICPSGVRTLSRHEVRFAPGRYHSGQVWPHDTHAIGRGAARHGARALAAWCERAVLRTCGELRHFPESVRGADSLEPSENHAVLRVTEHDPALGDFTHQTTRPGQAIQGWAVTAWIDAQIQLRSLRGATAATPLERRLLGSLAAMQRRAPAVEAVA